VYGLLISYLTLGRISAFESSNNVLERFEVFTTRSFSLRSSGIIFHVVWQGLSALRMNILAPPSD
jgi:hypothetical protein